MTTAPRQHPKPRVTCRARPSLADDSRFDSLPLRCVPAAVGICSYRLLAARGETPAAFGRRCIPADCVAPPSQMADMLGRRALSAGRLAGLGATLASHHGLLAAFAIVSGAPVATAQNLGATLQGRNDDEQHSVLPRVG